jgi:transcriptional regulator of acetoin/glycerol metabolism
VATTACDLEARVREGAFRADLFRSLALAMDKGELTTLKLLSRTDVN